MASPSPILALMEAADPSMRAYGDAPEGFAEPVMVAEQFVELELEYAAIRKHAALMDQPQRGVIVVTGADRLEFLGRMITQEMEGLEPFHWRHSFWLNRKGRIDADMRVIVLPDRVVLEMDIHAVARAKKGLDAYIITEDVTLTDATQMVHRLGLHGPRAIDALASIVDETIVDKSGVLGGAEKNATTDRPRLHTLAQGQATTVAFGSSIVTVVRDDATGEVGLELFVPADGARALYEALMGLAHDHEGMPAGGAGKPRPPMLRPIGWHAFNIARIEGGTPLYNLDFGPSNLPHECGDEVLRSRVSFKKGCYLGQEIVARMDARGHPKVRLAALVLDGADARDEHGTPRQPVTGGPVFAPVDGMPDPNARRSGAITSSTVSPMRSSTPVAFAMVKYAMGEPGTKLYVAAEGRMVEATVQAEMAFWKRG
ncbi:MAG: aminomethyltransferase family protein [Phycisphaeraceae bacterium]|nr:aminomethyltransferase family protein [Phycisphaeraceae bacterium]